MPGSTERPKPVPPTATDTALDTAMDTAMDTATDTTTGAEPEQRSYHWSFPASAAAIAVARNEAADAVGASYPELSEDVRLVISELATNAVRHAGTPFRVHAVLGPRSVRVEVEDRSPALPVLRRPALGAPSGRGFHLIAAVCRRWGVRVDEHGKGVWVELTPHPSADVNPPPQP